MTERQKTRTPNTKPRLYIVLDADGNKSFVRAVEVRVSTEVEKIEIIDGAILPYTATKPGGPDSMRAGS